MCLKGLPKRLAASLSSPIVATCEGRIRVACEDGLMQRILYAIAVDAIATYKFANSGRAASDNARLAGVRLRRHAEY